MPRKSSRLLLFAIVLAALLSVAGGRRPQQRLIPAPLQASSLRCGMEGPDFECSVDRRVSSPDGGHPEERIPLFGLAAAGPDLPLPGLLFVNPYRAADAVLTAALLVRSPRARAPPIACC